MENQKTIVSHFNKDLIELEDDMNNLIQWHEKNQKHISGVNWKELDKVEGLVKKLKKYFKK